MALSTLDHASKGVHDEAKKHYFCWNWLTAYAPYV